MSSFGVYRVCQKGETKTKLKTGITHFIILVLCCKNGILEYFKFIGVQQSFWILESTIHKHRTGISMRGQQRCFSSRQRRCLAGVCELTLLLQKQCRGHGQALLPQVPACHMLGAARAGSWPWLAATHLPSCFTPQQIRKENRRTKSKKIHWLAYRWGNNLPSTVGG